MNEEIWLLICFVIFVFLVYKPISSAVSNFFNTHTSEIQSHLKNAETKYEDAKKNNEMIKKLYSEIDERIKEIDLKSLRSVELTIRKNEYKLSKILNQRQKHFKDQMGAEFAKIEKEVYSLILQKTKTQLITYYSSNNDIKNSFQKKSISTIDNSL